MNKTFLFIPFLALLGSSCNSGHFTTTPVIKNAQGASAFKAPTKWNAPINDNNGDEVAVLNLGEKYWDWVDASASSAGRWITTTNVFDAPTSINLCGHFYCDYYETCPWSQVTNKTYDKTIAVLKSGNTTYIGIHDDATSTMTPSEFRTYVTGKYFYFYPNENYTGKTIYDEGYQTGYQEGSDEGYRAGESDGYEDGKKTGYQTGYQIGYEEGQAYNQQIIANGQYTGLTAFPRRTILEEMAKNIVAGQEIAPQSGNFDLIDTNANYTIYIKWHYDGNGKRMIFQDNGNEIIGELFFTDVAQKNWSTTWFGKYDAELHYITASRKTYATDEPITMSFYPEVYLASTINGDVNTYFMGGGNAYQLGFADGQTYTIKSSETYNNVFTIFTPAFRAVADFFNLNIGPFKVWYFFAIPLIVTLLILVLRLVKH